MLVVLFFGFIGWLPLWFCILVVIAQASITIGLAGSISSGRRSLDFASSYGKIMFWVCAIPALVLLVASAGGVVAALMGHSIFLIGMVLAWSYMWLGYDWYFSVGWMKKRIKQQKQLETRIRPYVGQQPPNWIAQIAQRGWRDYAIQNGVLVRNTQPNTMQKVYHTLEKIGEAVNG